jgi:eukaryotic-like serine/threonine-protein kinase
MSLSPGVVLGPYEVVAPLGAGAMGEVYRASDPRLRREVAVKVLPPAFASDPGRLRRFEQEALAAASLNHPNILAVYDIGVHDGSPYIVSELLEGRTLRDSLVDGALTVRTALDHAVQIAHGLSAAHDKGIVHRDLKPENLFVTRDGRIKILDFGLAKLTQFDASSSGGTAQLTTAAGTEPGLIVGTVGYMSPEQVRGGAADHRSDIFAFGVILYEMLTGRRAFQGPSAVETMHAILKEDPPDIARSGVNVPLALEREIRRCFEKNPERRFQSARDLAFTLEAIASDSGASVVRTAVVDAPPPARRSTPILAVAVGVAIVAAAAGGFFAARRTDTGRLPTFARATFRRGTVQSARFAPDGQTIVYAAAWQGNRGELFSTRAGNAEARSLDVDGANILSISSTGEMALQLRNGNLARAPLAGGSPQEVVERVGAADWAPDGKSLAIVRVAGTRRRVEYPVGTVLYETPNAIAGITVAPDGRTIAVAEAPPGLGSSYSISLLGTDRSRSVVTADWRAIRGLVWAGNDELWFAGSRALFGTGTVYGVRRTNALREVMKVPGNLEIFDITRDGHVLISRSDVRVEVRGLAPGAARETDFSWFDINGLSDLTPDGRTVIITEDGEPGLQLYARRTDGSPAVRLGDGGGFALSPDGRSLLAQTGTPLRMGVMPVGPGEPRFFSHPAFESYQWANWFPDGKRIMFAGGEAGHALRLYVENADGSNLRPIAPEGTTLQTGSRAISPDGAFVAALQETDAGRGRRIVLVPVDGGATRPLPGAEPGWVPSGWSGDGRFLYVYRHSELPARVFKVDVATGRKELWKEIGPADVAGVFGLAHVLITPDGTSYAYNYNRTLSDLYVVGGLK